MKQLKHHKVRYGLAVLVIAVAVIGGLQATGKTHLFHKTAKVSAPTKPITQLPSQAAPAAKNPSTQNTDVGTGSMTDKNGQVPSSGVSTDPNQWATSTSGLITLKAPLSGGNFASGSTITGTASTGPVQYTLIDNQVGVISQGSINVVSGNFTAIINFKSYATSGRLDIFNVDASGKETNEVQVPINF